MYDKSRSPFYRIMNSFRYAFRGIGVLIRTEPNIRIHIMAAVVVSCVGAAFRLTGSEWCWVIIAIGLVMISEGFNTAIELLTDLVTEEYHPLAEKTKDVASGAVLIASLTAAAIGAIIFIPHLMSR